MGAERGIAFMKEWVEAALLRKKILYSVVLDVGQCCFIASKAGARSLMCEAQP